MCSGRDAVSGQGAVPVGKGMGEVASRGAVVRTDIKGQGAAPLAGGWVR